MTTGDLDVVASGLAANVVLHSPITTHPFEGRAAVLALLADVLDGLDHFEYVLDTAFEDGRVLGAQCEIAGREFELVEVLSYDDAGLIRDVAIQVRPLVGTLSLMAALGPRIALRLHGRGRALVMRLATAPLPALGQALDWIGYRLAGPWSA